MPDPACSPFALSLRKQSSQYRRTISEYLNWDIEAYTLPWMAFCAGLSINPPLSKHLRHMVGVLSMKQLDMLKDYAEVYDAFLSLLVSPAGPWTKGHRVREYRHAWWTDLATIKLD
ncbi:uncharacterized protein F5147DRAFT_653152 [Suillus discolor]|uniref:Uncharacterized protein n=1 Tax=Suillus discolor TaxID=1912936 RepID=A0A9P7F615_9AGAM|nr:uncharacterized protein F5147DRAFT_653152 [Suillus discolor]KAG2108072.1 hypothetical protein F5147DRAFT_653152 [Suillus discolor]